MAKASYYNILTMLLASSNLTQAFNIFWKFRSNSSECYKEEELIKLVQHNPTYCYQGTHDRSSPMSTKDCVRNIKCTKRNEEIDYDAVPMCKTEKEIICCLRPFQCKFDQKALHSYYKQLDCRFHINIRKAFLSIHKPAGPCAFPFTLQE
eukprot:TRINITY_DN19204_c0_g1_i1.p1 TRINITY_DN19204_c0_g1~~TRINITY_DN19204_c0_g1_i1.p1  ORF type:complete len:163 (-),score=25.39 TRINITY_DN19204_c0_g1_i1:17-466(-)